MWYYLYFAACHLAFKNLCSNLRLPPEEHFHFNPHTQQCESFSFFHCPSNGNDFATQAECNSTCLATQSTTIAGTEGARSPTTPTNTGVTGGTPNGYPITLGSTAGLDAGTPTESQQLTPPPQQGTADLEVVRSTVHSVQDTDSELTPEPPKSSWSTYASIIIGIGLTVVLLVVLSVAITVALVWKAVRLHWQHKIM